MTFWHGGVSRYTHFREFPRGPVGGRSSSQRGHGHARQPVVLVLAVGLAWLSLWPTPPRARGQDVETPPAARTETRRAARPNEVQAYLESAAGQSPRVQLVPFGRSVEGRRLTAAIVADPPVSQPLADSADPRLRVLIVANGQADEAAGTQACLRLLDRLTDPRHRALREHCIVLLVPNWNPDAAARLGQSWRPYVNVPPGGAGWPVNVQQRHLLRDSVKLETPEARALQQLVQAWQPHAAIFTEATSRDEHGFKLTLDTASHPVVPKPLRNFASRFTPKVIARLKKQGFLAHPAGQLAEDQWKRPAPGPNHVRDYYGLRGLLAVSLEANSRDPFGERIEASEQALLALLQQMVAQRQKLRKLVDAARTSKPASQVPLDAKVVAGDASTEIRLREPPPAPQSESDPQTRRVPLADQVRGEQPVDLPLAYALDADATRLATQLQHHGLPLRRLTESVQVEVETATVASRKDTTYDEGHRLQKFEVQWKRHSATLDAGQWIVPLEHPLAPLAVLLLEPASPEGLAAWGFYPKLSKGERLPIVRVVGGAGDLPVAEVERIDPGQRLTLEAIYDPARRESFGGSFPFDLQWETTDDGLRYTRQIAGKRLVLDPRTGGVTAVPPVSPAASNFRAALTALPEFTAQEAARIADSARVAPDESGRLVSFKNDLYYWDGSSPKARRLTSDAAEEQYPSFSPDSQWIAFVRDYNLHVVRVDGEVQRALTHDGTEARLMGRLDWVYQEEIYGRGNFRGFWWSPDSRWLALLSLDQSKVKSYTVVDHLPYRQTREETRYPKAGDPIPSARLGVVHVAGGDVRWIDHPEYSAQEHLIVRVGWQPEGAALWYEVQDRPQTWLDLRTADVTTGDSERLLRETSPAWVNVLQDPHWLADGSFLWSSERDGRKRIYHVESDGQNPRPLTPEQANVDELLGVDPEQTWLYYSAFADDPLALQAYRVPFAGGSAQRITPAPGYHRVRFDPEMRYFFDYTSRIDRPPYVELRRADGKRMHTVGKNSTELLAHYAVRAPERVELPARDGTILRGFLIRPADFDPARKYPVLCHVYSGPQAPTASDRWQGASYVWHQLLAQHGYCIWMLDNRSATASGVENAWPIHRKMGVQELRDIEDGLAWLRKKPWIDGDRIGIWGWSYGGYMTAFALTHSKSFKLGIAGAPVTDWRNYDAVYTERYMHLPQENAEGYKESSAVAAADQLHGRLLLVHGSMDDNVHLSNTLQFAYALQEAGKTFEMMIYPKNRHGITRSKQALHLRRLMTRFILDHL